VAGTLLAHWAGTLLGTRLLIEGIAFEPSGAARQELF
jgi:hypothetical protein